VSDRLTAVLRGYRLVSAAAGPVVPLFLARRLKRGKEHRLRVSERHGEAGTGRPQGPLVWLHGASVGELASVLPLVERIASRGVLMLVTSGTVTSGEIAEQRLPPGVIHQFLPIDVPSFVRRFLAHWQPDLALFVESDLWPNLVIETSRRRVPMILINGRVSERSFRRWRYLPRTIGNLLRRFDLCLARTPDDAGRFIDLGAPRVVTSGDLKLDVPAPPADPAELEKLRDALFGRTVIAAASTHAGEEEAVIAAHARLKKNFPDLLTLIAPRHAERGDSIVDLVKAAGLGVAQRSRGEKPNAKTGIYVADTMGELGLIYRLAPVVFIGGSLIRHGGQNPIEPAKLGAAILHGPHVWNFTDLYDALDAAGGAQPVDDAERLATAFSGLLTNATARARAAKAGRATVEGLAGALSRTLDSLEPYLLELQMRHGAHRA